MFLSHCLLGMTVTEGGHGQALESHLPALRSPVIHLTPSKQTQTPEEAMQNILRNQGILLGAHWEIFPLSVQLLCVTDTSGTYLPLNKQNSHAESGADAQRQQFLYHSLGFIILIPFKPKTIIQ